MIFQEGSLIMANLRTTTDILQDIVFRCGEVAGQQSDYYPQALVDANRAYHSLCIGGAEIDPNIDEIWWWLKKATPGVLTLLPSFNVGSVSVTQGSQNVIFSNTPTGYTGANISLVGYFFTALGDNGDMYRVATHTVGSTSATLDSPYTGTTNPTATFKALPLIYNLANDVSTIVGRMRGFQQGRFDIDGTDLNKMLQRFPPNQIWLGTPREFAMTQPQQVQFSHYMGDDNTCVARVEYDYNIIEPDLVDDNGMSSPLTPFPYNHVISDWACYLILLDKDETKAATFEQMARGGLQAMSKEHRRRLAKQTDELGHIFPRQRDMRRLDGPLRTASGLIIG